MDSSSESPKLIATAKFADHSTANAAPCVQRRALEEGKRMVVAVRRRWKRTLFDLLAIAPLFALAILLALLLGLPKIRYRGFETFGCDPSGDPIVFQHIYDGRFWTKYRKTGWAEWNISVREHKSLFWDVRNTLVITLAFGAMPFSLAKLIDVAWDLIVGRGCQIASIYFIYYLYTGVFAESMRHRPSPLDITLSVQYSTASPSAFLTHLRHLRTGSSSMPRRKYFAMLVLVAAIAYVLLLPTWLSAMTGYQAQTKPLLPTDDNTLVPFENLRTCAETIIDGSRVNLPETTCVPGGGELYDAVVAYLELYGMPGERFTLDNSSIFSYRGEDYRLDPPTLTFGSSVAYSYESSPHKGLTVDTLLTWGVCQPTKNYQWGFSFLLLFIFLIVTLLLATMLFLVWLMCYPKDGGVAIHQVFGDLATAVRVGDIVRSELGDNVATMVDKAMTKAMAGSFAGITLAAKDNA
ncbi:hypothetical protein LTR37_020855 [Vermiconidia calcicola]|uniref:Uncharacterized protein n=1 Tax=Vermiconidia calcicola TaxID=1690605 RepID=A0ACC3MAD5_9PEZI|nr:hypothetical protein LTR37_020855 [Vermiconidia calcicola]